MTRIKLNDDFKTIILNMSDGNPGAMNVMIDLLQIQPTFTDKLGGTGSVIFLDTMDIYGSDIWILYKDICGEDLKMLTDCLKTVIHGLIPQDFIKHMIDNCQGRGEFLGVEDMDAELLRLAIEKFRKEY